MTEIEKLFENAGVEHGPCKNYKRLECNSPFCDSGMCPYGIGGEKNPFTAEKQLELIKFLLYIDGCRETKYREFDEALAKLINLYWQDLTNQEKEEIRRILNE